MVCASLSGGDMEPGAAELYDQALLGILQHVGNVQDFLRVLFGFLYRKTDFYRLLRHPTDRMGFPPGAAQALVLQVRRGAVGVPTPVPTPTRSVAAVATPRYGRRGGDPAQVVAGDVKRDRVFGSSAVGAAGPVPSSPGAAVEAPGRGCGRRGGAFSEAATCAPQSCRAPEVVRMAEALC